jgi:transposase-like protein
MNFKNLKQLFDHFTDEATCRAYLEQQRWNGNIECPFCAATTVYKIEGDKRYKCADRFCAKKFSVTVYENSKIDLRTWFAAIYLVTSSKKGISSLQLHRQLGVTQKTAWFLLHRIREMLREKAPAMLSNMVEVDETYIGGKYKNKHKSVRKAAHESNASYVDNKTCVVALLERDNKVKTYVHNVRGTTLKDMVKQHVDSSARVFTDSLNAYKGLDKHFADHQKVNHDQDEYVRGEVYTNSVEGFFSLLKCGIYGIYHQVSPKHLHRYCDEFSSRYNTRKIFDNERFELSIKNSEGRLKYNQLIGK